MLGGHLLTLLDIVFNVPELLLKVVQALDRPRNFLLFALELLQRPIGQTEEIHVRHGLLRVSHLIHTLLLERKLLLNALLAERLILDHHDRLREVLLAQIHLHSVREEGSHGHLLLVFLLL